MLDFLQRLDHQLFFLLNNRLASPALDATLWWVSVLGDGAPLLIFLALALWMCDRPTFKAHYWWILSAVLMSTLLLQLTKYGVARPRPLKEFAALIAAGAVHINVVGAHLRNHSFPSGHTQIAATTFTYLGYLYPKRWYLWVFVVVVIGFSRVYLGAHFPSDVLGGAGLGSLTAAGVILLRRRWKSS